MTPGNPKKSKNAFTDMRPKKSPLTYGPLPLSFASSQLTDIVNKMLRGKTANFSYTEEYGLEVEIGKKTYNISLLLEAADFNQLLIDRKAMKEYPLILQGNKKLHQPDLKKQKILHFPTEKDFRKLDVNGSCKNVSYAEMLAINIYTTNFYSKMNPFLRGDMTVIAEAAKQGKNTLNTKAQELLLSCCLAASGLNKVTETSAIPKGSFRGDTRLPDFVLRERMKAASVGKVTQIGAFTSTSMEKKSAFAGKVQTKFYNLIGKNIASISAFPKEKEFLIPPTQMQWTAVEINKKTGVIYLMGKPVSSPDYTKDTRVVETHAKLMVHRKTLTDVSQVLSVLDQRLHKFKEHSKIWQKGDKVLAEYLRIRTDALKKRFQEATAKKALKTKTVTTLSKHVKELGEAVGDVHTIIADDRKLVLAQLRSAVFTKTTMSRWFVMDKGLLKAKDQILMEVQQETERLLEKDELTDNDLFRLAKKINQGVTKNQALVNHANERRIFFKATLGKTDEVLRVALKRLNSVVPSINPKPLAEVELKVSSIAPKLK